MSVTLILLIGLAIIFNFLNGVHDSSNIVATMISSRAIAPRAALTITAIAEFCGPFIFGVAVANGQFAPEMAGAEIGAADGDGGVAVGAG